MKWLVALALLFAPAAAPAQREMIEIRAGEPVTIRPDRAYLLFRRVRPEGVPSVEAVFLRLPTPEDMERSREIRRRAFVDAEARAIRQRESALRAQANARAQGRRYLDPIPEVPTLEAFAFAGGVANMQNIDDDRELVRGRPESIYLVEVPPGDYVLYGASFGGGVLEQGLHACWCLGTVGFPAPAGVVTDLGYFIADMVHRESSIPELRPESGFGPSSNAYLPPLGATVRPTREGASMPEMMGGATVRPADYRAVGKFFDPRAVTINRLVPVPGILAYDGGRVIDVRTGQEAVGGHY